LSEGDKSNQDNVLPFDPSRRARPSGEAEAGAAKVSPDSAVEDGVAAEPPGGARSPGGPEDVAADEAARERIRRSLDESLLVEAAAGTGKTTVLVERLVATLAEGRARPDSLVALTFTRKAAGELKLRLRQSLDAALDAVREEERAGDGAGPGSASPRRKNLEFAIARLEEARIGTIHSFCADILHERPVEAEVDPGFTEVADGEDREIFKVAFDRFIQEQLEEMRPGLRRALSRLALDTNFFGTPLDRLRDAAWSIVEWRDFPSAWRRDPFEREWAVDELVTRVHRLAEHARSGRSGDGLVWALDPVVLLDTWIERSDAEARHDYDGLEARLIDMHRLVKNRERSKGSGKFAEALPREQVLEERRLLMDNLEKFADAANADLAAALHEELLEVVDRYEDQKRRSGRLDFSDLLLRARRLLRDHHQVRAHLQREISHVFVDEFQDTDPLQAEILLLLVADDPAQADWRQVRPEPGKLFLVGDPKQSIYRFRRADVRLYQEIKERLTERGVETVFLSRSFRAVPEIQRAINAAFRPEMDGDRETGNPEYLSLVAARPDREDQPAVVVLPPPAPYGRRRLADSAIDGCQPATTAAFVAWLLAESGWQVEDSSTRERRNIVSSDVCLLFRRFVSWGRDVTRGYTSALESFQIPHVLVGSRTFYQREEVETLRSALTAIEWPDDELAVYATLKGSLFAFNDDQILAARAELGWRFHPLRVRAYTRQAEDAASVAGETESGPLTGGTVLGEDSQVDGETEITSDEALLVDTLQFLGELHHRRNRRAIVETVQELLGHARAHAAFALRPAGQQVLSNVDRVCDVARRYELSGGRSFRGFVELLDAEAEKPTSHESPVVEEEAEGVRLMTVHNAKGLEFPVVILADMTGKLHARKPQRTLDPTSGVCVQKLLGLVPIELLEQESRELARERAEGLRVAYVAATRARDFLVVPAVGDEPRAGWVEPLNKAVYPGRQSWRDAKVAPACPEFGDASVLVRPPEFDPRSEISVQPGRHAFEDAGEPYSVVWWDPGVLPTAPDANFGLRQMEILTEDEGGHVAEYNLARYQKWVEARRTSSRLGEREHFRIETATEVEESAPGDRPVEVVYIAGRELPALPGGRSAARRFGTLVHTVMRDVDFGAEPEQVEHLARVHGRFLESPPQEIARAVRSVCRALAHPLLARAATLDPDDCRREMEFVLPLDEQRILEGAIDLALRDQDGWRVVDFKTDLEIEQHLDEYRRQIGWYGFALERLTGEPVRMTLLVL
jgi:ATP-dependent exoDNAse (exonuclease V) beta subunit